VHRLEEIAVYHVAPSFLDELATHLAATTTWNFVRNDGQIYVDVSGSTVEGAITRFSLVPPEPEKA
jgi:hypothetical protein